MAITIYIDTDKVDSKYDILREQQRIFENTFNEYRTQIEKIQTCWTGNNGENAYNSLKDHHTTFQNILDKLDDNNTFLKSAEEAYIEADQTIYNIIEDNASM